MYVKKNNNCLPTFFRFITTIISTFLLEMTSFTVACSQSEKYTVNDQCQQPFLFMFHSFLFSVGQQNSIIKSYF